MSLNDVSGTVAAIAVILVAIYGYWKLRHLKEEAISMFPDIVTYLEQRIKADAEAYLNSEQGQKALYQIGGLIGGGARAGIGLSKGSGRHSMQDFLLNLAQQYLFKGQPQGEQPQNSNTQQW